jgi:hypothetical protein
MVGAAITVGFIVGATVAVPAALPAVALRAAAVYRLEVGSAISLGLYLAAMAFVLALRNRGFTEFGTGGVRAQDLNGMTEAMRVQERSLEVLASVLAERRNLGEKDRHGRDRTSI